ncbi:MAG: EamA family transporter [Aeromonas sp.]
MPYLLAVTLLWSVSFSLIGVYLAGQVDAYFAVLTRIGLASLLFLPFLRPRYLSPMLAAQLMVLGAVQLGLMYLFYYHGFALLSVPEVLIFTIFTPLYVALLSDALSGRVHFSYLGAALLAVVGAAVMRWGSLSPHFWLGALVMQGSNLCFALGQVGYKHLLARLPAPPPQRAIFGCFYLGALVVALPAWLWLGSERYPASPTQWGVLIWLGLIASGLGYFGWNKGATQVSGGTLAVMNNALIPVGLVVNLLLWQQDTDLLRLGVGSGLMLASLLCCRPARVVGA